MKFFEFKSKELKQAEKELLQINAREDEVASLSDEQLKAKTQEFKDRIANGATLESIKIEAFLVAREATKRVLGKRLFDVQILGSLVLHKGSVAEMKTGEGKTITSIPTVYLNALTGKSVIVSTVNEYLTERDAEETGQVYTFLGLTVGVNKREKDTNEKRAAYACDITYSVHSEIGFDYLRDNMVKDMADKVQRPFYYCLVDEVDSILIDEARTPLIVTGGQTASSTQYEIANGFVNTLKEDDYEIDWESKGIQLTPKGMDHANKFFGVKNIFEMAHSEMVHRIQNSLRANLLMFRDADYIVRDGKILLVDAFTGRVMEGRSYSDGLQQAIQAKEKVEVEPETKTLATITYQNLFRMFKKLCGMTGTAKTEEMEFTDIYNIRVHKIPTNRPLARIDHPDVVYVDLKSKYKAIAEDIKERHAKGQPVLLGTEEVGESEILSNLLKEKGIPHTILNAKQNEQEAEIISVAGKKGAVTIATNMAGRGTDIKPDAEAIAAGGLYVIGTNKAESRRIDNQLKGRSGRQGDIGESRFYLSLEDKLIRRFSNQSKLQASFKSFGDKPISGNGIKRALERAQRKIEGFNFDTRKNVLQFDDVVRQQRDLIYSQRDIIISNKDLYEVAKRMMSSVVRDIVDFPNFKRPDGTLDIDNLVASINQVWFAMVEFKAKAEDLNGHTKEELIETLNKDIHEVYDLMRDRIVENVGESTMMAMEREVILMTFDQNWQIHIDDMSKLRSASSMAHYAQKNPYQEYVEKGTELFNELLKRISHNSVRILLQNKYAIPRKAASPVEKQIKAAVEHALKNINIEDVQEIKAELNENTPLPDTEIRVDGEISPAIVDTIPAEHVDHEEKLDVTEVHVDEKLVPEQLIEVEVTSPDEKFTKEQLEEIKNAVKEKLNSKE